jgi:hypothetical protein
MPEEEVGIPPHSRLHGVLEYLTILGAAIAGMAHAPPWITVPLAAVVMLWVSDRGQHGWLVERVRTLLQVTSCCSRSARRSYWIWSRPPRPYVFRCSLVGMDGMSLSLETTTL